MFNKNVAYLEDTDFDSRGRLMTDSDYVVLVFANWCMACTHFKPIFQEFADQSRTRCAVIESDGTLPGQEELNSRLKQLIPDLGGFPTLVFFRNGKILKTHTGSLPHEDLQKWVGVE